MSWATSNRRSRLPSDWFGENGRRKTVLRRDNYLCLIKGDSCLGVATQVDHIKAGDDHSYSNLQSVCSRCHAHKSSVEGNAKRRWLKQSRLRPKPKHPGSIRRS